MSSEQPLIVASGVSKLYRTYARPEDRLKEFIFRGRRKYSKDFWAVKDVSFEIGSGETVGIVGRNGSGKSTLLKMICGTLRPTQGDIAVEGRISALLELGAGFNPEFSGRENVSLNAALLGLTPAEIAARYDEILAFADIGDYINQPVKHYSSGMFARLAFAVAVHVDPKILIVDEILAVGDVAFQRKCIERIFRIKEGGCTILFVSHDPYQVKTICNKALYLKNGQAMAFGEAAGVVDHYIFDVERADNFPAAPQIELSPEASCEAAVGVGDEEIASGVVDDVVDASDRQTPSSIAVVSDGQPPSGELLAKRKAGAGLPPFVITGIEVVVDGGPQMDGRLPEVIRSGARVEIAVSYRATAPDFPRIGSFVFNLKRHDDFYVCGATTLMDRFPPVSLKSKGKFSIQFPNLNLLAGRYKIRFAINDEFGLAVLTERLEAWVFQVVDDHHSQGLIDLARRWSLS